MIILSIILGIISFLLILLHWYQTRSRFALLLNQFPMVPYKPILGHIVQFTRDPEKAFLVLRKMLKKFNESSAVWSATYGGIHIITPDDAKIILSNVNYIRKGIFYIMMEPWLCKGLLTSDGAHWQHRRKILTPTFHFNILQKFVEIFEEHSMELVKKLKEETKNKETNLYPLITHETLTLICETALGTKLNMNDKTHSTYLHAMHSLTPLVIKRVLNPFLYLDFLFAISPLGITQNGYIKTLRKITNNIIKKREADFKDNDLMDLDNSEDNHRIKKKRLAMLDLLISAKKNREIDFEGIREEVDTFMFGGHDTTAIAIIMNLMLLAHHKNIQDKIINELTEIFGDNDRPASYEDLTNMKYLEMCIKEGLRLYPSIPIISRRVAQDIQLTHRIAPAKTVFLIHIYDIHRNEKIYPDPEKYDPDRFLPENVKGRHPYAYIPFSAGPRNCIGQKFALLEMKSIISSILRNFTLEPVTEFNELRWTIDIVLRVNGPINVKFIARK